MFKLAKDAISKNSIVFKVFFKKFIKLFVCHWIFGFEVAFLLILLLNYCFREKRSSKKDLI